MPYSRAGLVQVAREAGFEDVNERLITEWVQLGLLDTPERVGRKDGKRGAFYQWPDNQFSLLVTILGKRSEVRHTKALVIIPVGIWLYWGDEWITLRQVRRALVTSIGLYGPPGSWERAQANAREVVGALRREDAPRDALSWLREELALALYNCKVDVSTIRPLVEDVLKSDTATGGWGPFGWDVNQVVDMLRVTVEGINHIGSATTRELTDARDRLRAAVLDYASSWKQLSRLPRYGHSFEQLTLDMLIERSCRDLVAQVGMEMLAKDEGQQLPPAPSIDWAHPPMHLLPLRANLVT